MNSFTPPTSTVLTRLRSTPHPNLIFVSPKLARYSGSLVVSLRQCRGSRRPVAVCELHPVLDSLAGRPCLQHSRRRASRQRRFWDSFFVAALGHAGSLPTSGYGSVHSGQPALRHGTSANGSRHGALHFGSWKRAFCAAGRGQWEHFGRPLRGFRDNPRRFCPAVARWLQLTAGVLDGRLEVILW